MPRVHYVKKARKDNPAVKKGESYFWWKHAFSPKRCSKTRPRASQLTQSDKLSRYYEAQETIEDIDTRGSLEEITSVLQEAAENVRGIAEGYQESADNIREHFAESEVADECEEKVYACEATADSINEAISILEDTDPEVEPVDRLLEIINSISWEL